MTALGYSKPVNQVVISAAAAALMLHAKLGEHRNWMNWLADWRRGHGGRFFGLAAPDPVALQRDDWAFRPVYAKSDIQRFINEALAAMGPEPRMLTKPRPLPITPGRCWRLNKFDQSGHPTARLHCMAIR